MFASVHRAFLKIMCHSYPTFIIIIIIIVIILFVLFKIRLWIHMGFNKSLTQHVKQLGYDVVFSILYQSLVFPFFCFLSIFFSFYPIWNWAIF